jgi:hypothetical protein
MSDPENTPSADVGVEDTADLTAALSGEPRVEVLPDAPMQNVRIGGSPGVRVQHVGTSVTQTKRVTGGETLPDHRQVPCAVLAEVNQMLRDQTLPLTAAVRLDNIAELLQPWL